MVLARIIPSILCLLLIGIFTLPSLQAQEEETAFVRQKIDKAISLMEAEEYEEANKLFRQVLASGEVIPPRMCYLFAETLYMVGQFRNAKSFVRKYFELTGRAGDYYEEATKLEGLLDHRLKEVSSCKLCNGFGFRLTSCETCDGAGHVDQDCDMCNGKGKVSCRKCEGQGVFTSSTAFGMRAYHSCDLCESKGFTVCSKCEGENVVHQGCKVCQGTGQRPTRTVCNHKPLP